MTDENIGERAERRRNRQVMVLIGMSVLAGALQVGVALMASNSPDGSVPLWLTAVAAASVAGLMFALFRMGDRISDEFKQRQIAFVAISMMKALFVIYPAWLVLEHGGLVPRLGATELFAGQMAVMFVSLIWCRIRG